MATLAVGLPGNGELLCMCILMAAGTLLHLPLEFLPECTAIWALICDMALAAGDLGMPAFQRPLCLLMVEAQLRPGAAVMAALAGLFRVVTLGDVSRMDILVAAYACR